MMYDGTNHMLRKSSLLRAMKIMEHSLITNPTPPLKYGSFLDFSADPTKTVAGIAKE